MCSFPKNGEIANLLHITDLIIWDEAPMQHDKLFEGIVVVFGGDFKQILPVIVKGSYAQVVGANLQCFHLWHSIIVLYLTQNMRLNTSNDVECQFAVQIALFFAAGMMMSIN